MNPATDNESGAEFVFRPIGYVRSVHTDPKETPIQPVYTDGTQARVEVLPEYEAGLRDLEGFSHIYLIYYFHRAKPVQLVLKPYLEDTEHGIFATRTPHRPNPIGFSLVRLVERQGNILIVKDVDILDGTPLLDIKPFIPRFDYRQDVRVGWQEQVPEQAAQSRGRRLQVLEDS